MARYRRRDSIEAHLAEAVEAGGRSFSAELIAKRATGVSGYKMTLGFFELEGSDAYLVELDPAISREEVARRAEELQADPAQLLRMLEAQLAEGD
jgi:hypothetical protein